MVRLKEVRRELGYTGAGLADKSGVSLSTIVSIENGYHEPRPSTLRRLADALGVDIRELTRGPMVTIQMPSGTFGLVSTEDLKRFQQQQEK